MTPEEIMDKILARNPGTSQKQILEELEIEKSKTGGLIADETLLRLIAARYGIDVPQKKVHRKFTIKQMVSGLNDVTLSGRIVALFPPRKFSGERCGKVASLIVADEDKTLRVVLWNDNVSLIESGQLRTGQVIHLLHGYTREDRRGQLELHLGRKSRIVVESQNRETDHNLPIRNNTKIKDCRAT